MTSNVCRKALAALALIGFLYGCGGSGGSSSTEAGISVGISAQLRPTPNTDASITTQPAGEKTFLNSEGTSIRLTRAYVVFSSITLESSCDSTAFAQLDLTAIPRALVNLLIPSAEAHTTATPTQTGEPHVLNLLAADMQSVDIGELAPPAGSYCGITANLSAADGDAAGLPTDFNMVGKTLHIEGQALVGDVAVPFSLETSIAFLPASIPLDEQLVLDSSHRIAAISLSIHYQRWFDGINLTSLDQVQQEIVLGNVHDSLDVVVE